MRTPVNQVSRPSPVATTPYSVVVSGPEPRSRLGIENALPCYHSGCRNFETSPTTLHFPNPDAQIANPTARHRAASQPIMQLGVHQGCRTLLRCVDGDLDPILGQPRVLIRSSWRNLPWSRIRLCLRPSIARVLEWPHLRLYQHTSLQVLLEGTQSAKGLPLQATSAVQR
jgi:hypothetical protein